MHQVLDNVWTWSVYSEEKKLDFNGWYVRLGDEAVLIDPPPLTEEARSALDELGRPSRILLTNKDHRRAAPEARDRFGAPILIHEDDAELVDCKVDGTFDDGDHPAPGLEVIQVKGAKSPGESALWWEARGVLFIGDALIGRDPGRLSLLPPDKLPDIDAAKRGVERLARLPVQAVLVGDGHSVLEEGAAAIRAFLENEE